MLLTIHQPRLEIFHLFHKILLLCDGQVSNNDNDDDNDDDKGSGDDDDDNDDVKYL